MAVYYTGIDHDTPSLSEGDRDYDMIVEASNIAAEGVENQAIHKLAEGTMHYYQMQLKEGMEPLPGAEGMLAHKYCGGGFGGYALYLFEETEKRDAFVANNEEALSIEPYLRPIT